MKRPLFEAVASNQINSVKALLKKAPKIKLEFRTDVNLSYKGKLKFYSNKGGPTPFMVAIIWEEKEIAIALLEAGAEIHADELPLESQDFIKEVNLEFLKRKNARREAAARQKVANPGCQTKASTERTLPSKINFSVE